MSVVVEMAQALAEYKDFSSPDIGIPIVDIRWL